MEGSLHSNAILKHPFGSVLVSMKSPTVGFFTENFPCYYVRLTLTLPFCQSHHAEKQWVEHGGQPPFKRHLEAPIRERSSFDEIADSWLLHRKFPMLLCPSDTDSPILSISSRGEAVG